MLGYPVITAYYQVSVRLSLTLPSASFSQLLTKLTLPQLMDRSISAHEGLEPSTLTSCPAHIYYTILHYTRKADTLNEDDDVMLSSSDKKDHPGYEFYQKQIRNMVFFYCHLHISFSMFSHIVPNLSIYERNTR